MKIIKILLVLLTSVFLMSAQNVLKKQITLYLPSSETEKLITINKDVIIRGNDDLADVIFSLLKRESSQESYIKLYSDNSYATSQKSKAQVVINKNHISNATLSDELLIIYSAVNSLTSSGDIITVDFLIDGESQKDLYGYIDMRETFIPDYDICS